MTDPTRTLRSTLAAPSPVAFRFARHLAFALAGGLLTPAARADDLPRTPANPAYQRECGECHVAYPPALLTVDDWRQVMGRLDRHYGVDASIDAATVERISAWLQRHGATRGKFVAQPHEQARDPEHSATGAKTVGAGVGAQPPRLTDTAWFRHEHDEAPASARRNAGSMARCDACHRDAAKGDYSEHNIRFPQKAQGGQS